MGWTILASVQDPRRGSLGHALTGVRLATSPFIFLWVVEGRMELAAAALAAAMLTDVADGPLVRRFGRPSRVGALFDVSADFLVIVSAFAAMAIAGVLPSWPLLPIVASFAVFIGTLGLCPTMYDPVGRYIGGILMTGALAVLLAQETILQLAIASAMTIACITTIGVRLAHVLRRSRQNGS